jgi:hypothetical protein
MTDWTGWELGRVVVLASAVMYAGIWVQVTLFHWGGAFASRAMWAPVLLTPLIVVAAALGVVDASAFGWVAAGALALGVLDGLYGVYRHLRGVVAQIGGLTVRNLIAGPPFVLPLAYSLVGALGLVGLLWDG